MKLTDKAQSNIFYFFIFVIGFSFLAYIKKCSSGNNKEKLPIPAKVEYQKPNPQPAFSKHQTEVFDYWIKNDSTRFKQ